MGAAHSERMFFGKNTTPLGRKPQKHAFASLYASFSSFLCFSCKKCKKACLDQRSVCLAPKHWSKYTKNTFLDHHPGSWTKTTKNCQKLLLAFLMFLKLIKIIVLGAFYNKHFLLTHKNEVWSGHSKRIKYWIVNAVWKYIMKQSEKYSVINIETHRHRTKGIRNKFKIKLKGNLKAYTIKDFQIFLFKRELKTTWYIVLLLSFFDD